MRTSLKHFLLIARNGRSLGTPRSFNRPALAVAAFEEAEAKYRNDGNVQVVLVAARSLDDVKLTHANYFESIRIEDMLRRIEERGEWMRDDEDYQTMVEVLA